MSISKEDYELLVKERDLLLKIKESVALWRFYVNGNPTKATLEGKIFCAVDEYEEFAKCSGLSTGTMTFKDLFNKHVKSS